MRGGVKTVGYQLTPKSPDFKRRIEFGGKDFRNSQNRAAPISFTLVMYGVPMCTGNKGLKGNNIRGKALVIASGRREAAGENFWGFIV